MVDQQGMPFTCHIWSMEGPYGRHSLSEYTDQPFLLEHIFIVPAHLPCEKISMELMECGSNSSRVIDLNVARR